MLTVEIHHDPHDERYEALVEGALAGFAAYRTRPGGVRAFIHTEVEEAYEGKGVGSELVRRALEETREQGLRVQPDCPFVRSYVERHPEFAPLVAAPTA